MIITDFHLSGYKRLALRKIKSIHYKPKEKAQVILGSNGSGKSSLIRELSPLPSNYNDYPNGGFKKETIHHNGVVYQLENVFDENGNSYYFIVDGVNLNPGLNITTYRELVKEHFGYTQDIHDVITGVKKFTSMSVSERRSWMLRLSDADYSYALKYHKRLAEQIRDLQGSIKRNQERLAVEVNKDVTPEMQKQLEEDARSLTEILYKLLESKQNVSSMPSMDYHSAIHQTAATIESLIESLDGIAEYKDERTLNSTIHQYRGELNNLLVQIKDLTEKIEGYIKRQEALAKTNNTSASDVIKAIENLEEEIDGIQKQIALNIHVDDPVNTLSALTMVEEPLTNILTHLDSLDRANQSPEALAGHLKQESLLTSSINELIKRSDDVFLEVKDLEEAKSKGTIQCPSCQYSWVPNYNEVDFSKKRDEHRVLVRMLEQRKEEHQKLTKIIQNSQRYFDLHQQFYLLQSQFASLRPFFNYVASTDKLETAPSSITVDISRFKQDLNIMSRVSGYNKLLTEQKELLKAIQAAKDTDTSKLQEIINQEELSLVKLQNRHRELVANLQRAEFYSKTYTRITELYTQFRALIKDRKAYLDNEILVNYQKALNEIIQAVRLELNTLQQSISYITTHKAQITRLKEQIEEDQYNQSLLKMAEKALSPKEGLIALGMSGFINYFVALINDSIGTIWKYPFELVPIDITSEDGVELDYKFSVDVDGRPAAPDISEASTAQQEIINLAFVMVMMRVMKLFNYPLFLDEFASSMDYAHRLAAYQAIDSMIDSEKYSQIFMVSHYEQGYGGLNNHEILMLCDANVPLPAGTIYNRHVEIVT